MYKLIIVDDNYVILDGMKLIIDWAEYGIEVVGTAFSGNDGIELAKELKPHIILTDIKMRGMDGLSMIKQIKASGIDSEFIIMSGYRDFDYAQQAMELGVRSYILKPVSKAKLIETVKRVTENLDKQNITTENTKQIEEIVQYVNAHFCDEDFSLQKLAHMYYINIGHLSTIFKEYTGEGYVTYVTNKKIEMAKKYLKNSDLSIGEIAEQLNFKNVNYFSNLFKKNTGVSPQRYRKE